MAVRDVPHALADAAVVITLSLDRAARLERAGRRWVLPPHPPVFALARRFDLDAV
jgi:hypothetical protein